MNPGSISFISLIKNLAIYDPIAFKLSPGLKIALGLLSELIWISLDLAKKSYIVLILLVSKN